MGWITQEFSRRRPPQTPPASEEDRQRAAEALWMELRDSLRADINEYNRCGGTAILDTSGGDDVVVSEPAYGLQVRIQADLLSRNLRYEFQALRDNAAAPEGGFFSIRFSTTAQPELFSADQPLTLEQARRVLLQPVLFPSDTSTPLRQSA